MFNIIYYLIFKISVIVIAQVNIWLDGRIERLIELLNFTASSSLSGPVLHISFLPLA